MTYASLSEVYGTDFSNLVNPQQQQQYVTKKSNPNVMNHNRSRNLKELKNQSMIQQEMDYDTQNLGFLKLITQLEITTKYADQSR